MKLVNKQPYMGFNCINTLLFATTLPCKQASQKIISQEQYFEPLSGFCYIKKEVKQDKCLGQSNDSFCDIFLLE